MADGFVGSGPTGDLDINDRLHQAFQQEILHRSRNAYDMGENSTSFEYTMVGYRRLLASDNAPYQSPRAKWASAEYHWDGAGAYSLGLQDLEGLSRALNHYPDIPQLVDDDMLVLAVLTGLHRLSAHARDRAAAGGNALVRAELLPSTDLNVGLDIGRRGYGGPRLSNVTLRDGIAASETEASLDDMAQPGPGLVAAAARLVDGLGQAFGIPEMVQLTRDGEIVTVQVATGVS